MLATALLLFGVLIAGIVFFIFAYKYSTYNHLQYVLTALVASLPFEQFPTISIGSGNLKLGHILTFLALGIVLTLIIKKDPKILNTKVSYFLYFTVLFFLASIPSWFVIENYTRFYVTMIPTVIVFLGANLIGHFLEKPIRALNYLFFTLFISCLFAVFQFVGDMVGVSPEITLLAERYTKTVFGYPRVHSFAIEPLYFAGMLFLPIISFVCYWLFEIKKNYFFLNEKWHRLFNLALGGFFGLFLFITISKSAIGILGLLVFFILVVWLFLEPKKHTISQGLWAVGGVVLLGLFLNSYIPAINSSVMVTIEHFVDTFSGRTASSGERSVFYTTALNIIPTNVIIGIGSGQYGVVAENALIEAIPPEIDGGYYIVNNVYLEVLLELGITALFVFVSALFVVIKKSIRTSIRYFKSDRHSSIQLFALAIALIGSAIQWNTFSPIYIMPIFILIGVAISIQRNLDQPTIS